MFRKIALILCIALMVFTAIYAQELHTDWKNRKNIVYWSTHRGRWIDAIGEGVVKWINDFTQVPIGADNSDPNGWVVTVIAGDAGSGTMTAGTTNSGELVITTDDTENDGVSLYLDGEAWKLEDDMPLSFYIRLKLSDADQCDLIVALATKDTGIWASVPNDIVYFHSADETATASFSTGKDSTYTADTSAGTLTQAYHELEFFWDGSTYVHAYFDGTLVASSATNIPNDEALTLHIELLTGEGNVNTVTVDEIRIIQVRT